MTEGSTRSCSIAKLLSLLFTQGGYREPERMAAAAAATQGQFHSVNNSEEAENHGIQEKNNTARQAGVPPAPTLPKKKTTRPPLTGCPKPEAKSFAVMIGNSEMGRKTTANEERRRKLVVDALKEELWSHLQATQSGSSTFCRVPSRLREGNESDFTPKVVSIGPYNNDDIKFKEMHDTKLKYLHALLKRSEENPLDRHAQAVNKKLDEVLSTYSSTVSYNDMDFVKMMVLDGCFIIEFLRRWYVPTDCEMSDLRMKQPLLRNDLLLVENQIPFFILEDLFRVTDLPELNETRAKDGDEPITIMELVLVYFTGDKTVGKLMAQSLAKEKKSFDSLLHLFHSSLDPKIHSDLKKQQHSTSAFYGMCLFLIGVFGYLKVAYKCMCSPFHMIYSSSMKICAWIIKTMGFKGVARYRRRWLHGIPNVRYLRNTGFHFRTKEATSCISDVTCTGKTIEIPLLSIQESTLTQLRNLVAFEQCYPKKYGHRFTAFVAFMNYLIDAKEDVAILKEYGIILNRLGDDEMVANFFNGLSGIYIENNDVPLFGHINEYYTRRCYRVAIYQWTRKLIPDFFTNPWAIPSMIAAFVLLVLTVVQTFYTIYPYYHPQ